MATSLGNLSVGLEIPGLAMLDALDARLRGLSGSPQIIKIGAETQQAELGIANIRTGLRALQGDTLGAATALEGLGAAAVGIGVIAADLAVATKEAAAFEQQMANLSAVLSNAPKSQFADLGANIQQSAKDTIFTISGIAEADRQLAKAGQDANFRSETQRLSAQRNGVESSRE